MTENKQKCICCEKVIDSIGIVCGICHYTGVYAGHLSLFDWPIEEKIKAFEKSISSSNTNNYYTEEEKERVRKYICLDNNHKTFPTL